MTHEFENAEHRSEDRPDGQLQQELVQQAQQCFMVPNIERYTQTTCQKYERARDTLR